MSKRIILILIATMQPLLWFFIYGFFYEYAKKIKAVDGLAIVSILSAFFIMLVIIIPVIEDWENNNSKSL